MTIDGVRIVIYPNDHPPPHVHAVGAEATARFVLNCPDGPVILMDAEGFRRAELSRIGARIAESLTRSCEAWMRIHG